MGRWAWGSLEVRTGDAGCSRPGAPLGGAGGPGPYGRAPVDAGGTGRCMGAGGGLLWGAYGISALGTWLAFDAFPLIAVLVLHSGPLAVSVLAAAGLAVGAVAAVPLGPWLEYRRKRPVMVATDLVRCAALLTIPVAHLLGALTFVHLLAVSVVVAAADIAFRSASGAYIKTLLPPEELLVVNARFESTNWTAIVLGPPLGGAMVGLFGPVVTVLADAASYLLSALGLRAITAHEPRPARREEAVAAGTSENTGNAEDTGAAKDGGPAENADSRSRTRELFDGWRFILRDPALRPLFGNTVLYNGLLMAISPLLAVLMLGPLGFAPGSTASPSRCPPWAVWSAPGWPAGWSPGSGSTGSCSPRACCAPAGRSAWPSSGPASPVSSWSSSSSSGSSRAAGCSTRCTPPTGWSGPPPPGSSARCPRGRSPPSSAPPR